MPTTSAASKRREDAAEAGREMLQQRRVDISRRGDGDEFRRDGLRRRQEDRRDELAAAPRAAQAASSTRIVSTLTLRADPDARRRDHGDRRGRRGRGLVERTTPAVGASIASASIDDKRHASSPSKIASDKFGARRDEAAIGLDRADRFAARRSAGRSPSSSCRTMRPGPGAMHDDARAEEQRLLDAVGDHQHADAAAPPRCRAAASACARASARRARRAARPSAGSPDRRRAPGPGRRAGACRRKAPRSACRRQLGKLDLRAAAASARRVAARRSARRACFSAKATLSRAVSQGNSASFWNTTARSAPGAVIGLPSTRSRAGGRASTKPAATFKSDVLPQPERPVSTTKSPAPIVKRCVSPTARRGLRRHSGRDIVESASVGIGWSFDECARPGRSEKSRGGLSALGRSALSSRRAPR